jgi:hypothetical protein
VIVTLGQPALLDWNQPLSQKQVGEESVTGTLVLKPTGGGRL